MKHNLPLIGEEIEEWEITLRRVDEPDWKYGLVFDADRMKLDDLAEMIHQTVLRHPRKKDQ